MKKYIVERASAFGLDFELSILIYGIVMTHLPKACLFSQAKLPTINLSPEHLTS